MAPFFKKKRQSAAPKQQQQQQQQMQVHLPVDTETRTAGNNGSGGRTAIQADQNPYSTPKTSSSSQQAQFSGGFSPQNGAYYSGSTDNGYQNQQHYSPGQYQPQYYNTANIPPQATFANRYSQQQFVQQQQQQQQYSRSATQAPSAQFNRVPYESPPQQHRYNPQYLQQAHSQAQRPQHPQQAAHSYQQQQFSQQPAQDQGARSPALYNERFTSTNQKPYEEGQRSPQAPSASPRPFASTPLQSNARAASSEAAHQSVVSKTSPWKRKKLFNSPFPRYRHTASSITADNGCMFIMGGLRDDNVYGDIWLVSPIGADSSEDYSYIAKPIETTDGVPAPRVCHNSILIGNAFIVYGGDTIALNTEGELDNDLYFFNINSMKWTTPSPSGIKPSGRYGHTITVVTFQNSNEQEESSWSSYLYLFGGQLDDERFNDMWCFDLSNFRKPTTQWRKIYDNDLDSQQQPPPLANHTMTVYDGRIYVYGGSTINGELSNSLYCFNPVDESWSACIYTSEFQAPAVEEHSSVLYDRYLISYGGKNAQGATMNDFIIIDLDTFQVFRIETPEEVGSPGRRAGHSLTYDMKNEKLLVMGGDQLNAENVNSSREDVVFDGLNKDDKSNDLLKFTSINPASLEYETTYIYEFSLEKLEQFINRSPDLPIVTAAPPQDEVIGAPSESPVSERPIVSNTPGARSVTPAHSLVNMDDRELISSTPLRNEDERPISAGNSTTGSIQLARKISIASHPNGKPASIAQQGGSSVKRVDSINVHKNRRIRSAGSFNGENAEIINSSRNITPVLKQVSPTEPKNAFLPQEVNQTQEEFVTPQASSSQLFEEPSFKPYHKVGSKVELGGDLDEDEQPNDVLNEPNENEASPEKAFNGATNFEPESVPVLNSSASAFPAPNEQNTKIKIPSAVSDATVNSFLDNYTNKTGSFDRESQSQFLQHSSSSSLRFSSKEELSNDEDTPLLNSEQHFDQNNDFSVTPPTTHSSAEKEKYTLGTPLVIERSTPQLANSANSTYSHNAIPLETTSRDISGSSTIPGIPPNNNLQMSELYARLNDLKKSLNEKMAFANEKIVGLERANEERTHEVETLKAQLAEKSAAADELREKHTNLSDTHAAKVTQLEGLVATHERSINEHGSVVDDLKSQLLAKDSQLAQAQSDHTASQYKLQQYELLINDKLLNLSKFSRVLQRQKDYVRDQQLKHIAQEEKLMKHINELKLENENLKVEQDKYKRMLDFHKDTSFDADDDAQLQDSESRKVSSGTAVNNNNTTTSEDDEYNDSSISELTQGLDKLIASFKSTLNQN